MPNQPKTPMRSFRLSDAYMQAIDAEAERRGENRTDVVRRALREHLALPEGVDEEQGDE